MAPKKHPDPLEVLANLPLVKNYTPADKYHDFRKVFSTPEGQRVFREILGWGHIFKPSLSGDPIDPLAMAVREGERNNSLRLLATYNNEPVQQANTQKREA